MHHFTASAQRTAQKLLAHTNTTGSRQRTYDSSLRHVVGEQHSQLVQHASTSSHPLPCHPQCLQCDVPTHLVEAAVSRASMLHRRDVEIDLAPCQTSSLCLPLQKRQPTFSRPSLQLQLDLQPPPPLLWQQLEIRVPVVERDAVAAEIGAKQIAQNIELHEECHSYYQLLLQCQSQLTAAVATAQRWQQHLTNRGVADAQAQKRNRLKAEIMQLINQLTTMGSATCRAAGDVQTTIAAQLDRALTGDEVQIVGWASADAPCSQYVSPTSGSTPSRPPTASSRPSTSTLPLRPSTASASRSQTGSRPGTAGSRSSAGDDMVQTAYSDATDLIQSAREWDALRLQPHYPLLRRAMHEERALMRSDSKWILAAIDDDVDQLTTEGTTVGAHDAQVPSVAELQRFTDALKNRLTDLHHEQRMTMLLDANRSANQLLPMLSPKSPPSYTAVRRQPSAPSSLSDAAPARRPTQLSATHAVPKPPSAPVQRSTGQVRARQYRHASIDSDSVEKLLSGGSEEKMQSPRVTDELRL